MKTRKMMTTVALAMAAGMFLVSGCASLGGKPDPRIGQLELKVATFNGYMTGTGERLDKMDARMDEFENALAGSAKMDKEAELQAAPKVESAEMGKEAKLTAAPTKAAPTKEVKKKTVKRSGVSWAAHNRLRDQVAFLKDRVDTYHSSRGDAVYFKPASSELEEEADKTCKAIAKDWLDGKINILAIRSRASKTKPKDCKKTNYDYAQDRLKAVTDCLEDEGVQIKGTTLLVVGESDQFANNRNVSFVIEDVNNEAIQQGLKAERAP